MNHLCLLLAASAIPAMSAVGPFSHGPTDPQASATPALKFDSSDGPLVALFDWARAAAARYVGRGTDPVGPWYEAALPGREAFCIRDVCHQCMGAEILGYGEQNRNMLRRFVEAVSPGRDYCSFWEIDRYNRPAPVDYASDDDFWYPLPASLDLLCACYRLYLWTGDSTYVEGPAFDRFFRLTLNEYVERWQLQPDRVLKRPGMMNLRPGTKRFRLTRGLPSYDEGHGGIVVGSDLVAMLLNGHRTYARILRARGQTDRARAYERRAAAYQRQLETVWWDPATGSYFDFLTEDGRFRTGGVSRNEFLLWHEAATRPERILSSLRAIGNTQVEVLSYLPMLYYRWGLYGEARRYLDELQRDPRRDYPEAPFAAAEAVICGLMGVRGDAGRGVITTCPGFTDGAMWVSVANLPVLGRRISVRHDSPVRTTFTNLSGSSLTWRAMFAVGGARIRVDGTRVPAHAWTSAVGRKHTWVEVTVKGGHQAVVDAEAPCVR